MLPKSTQVWRESIGPKLASLLDVLEGYRSYISRLGTTNPDIENQHELDQIIDAMRKSIMKVKLTDIKYSSSTRVKARMKKAVDMANGAVALARNLGTDTLPNSDSKHNESIDALVQEVKRTLAAIDTVYRT